MFHLFCKYSKWEELGYQVSERVCDYRLVMLQSRVCSVCGKRDIRKRTIDSSDSYRHKDVLQKNCDMLNRRLEATIKQQQVRD